MSLYLLAFIGALVDKLGAAAGVASARGQWPKTTAALCALCFALAAPPWIGMSRQSGGGFVEPAATWSVFSALLSAGLAWASGEPQSTGKWVGFGLIVAGAVVRGLSPRE